jgi:hypothetical protein
VVDNLILVLVIAIGVEITLMIPVLLRIKTLLLELLQSIVGKIEEGEPFIHGAGLPDEPVQTSFLAETVAGAEKEGLDNGTFRGPHMWEPPSDETKT